MPTVMNANRWNMEELTASILSMPPKPSLISDMGLFQAGTERVRQPVIVVEQADGELRLAKEGRESAPPELIGRDEEKTLNLSIPLYKLGKSIQWGDVNNIREFGGTNLRTIESEVAKSLRKIRDYFDATNEALRMSALKGDILDSTGSSLINLFTEFGVTQDTVSLELDQASENVAKHCREVWTLMQDNLKTGFSGITCVCGATVFDNMLGHANVKDLFTGFGDARELRADGGGRVNPTSSFTFNGITFTPYTRSFTESDGDSRDAIAATEGICFPTGADIYREAHAPADWVDVVNTPGLDMYAASYVNGDGPSAPHMVEGVMRPLPYVTRPAGLIKVTNT